MSKKDQYEFTIRHRISITENSTGIGHFVVFDTIEEASLHISKWIGKAETISYSKEWTMNKDLELAKIKDEKRMEIEI